MWELYALFGACFNRVHLANVSEQKNYKPELVLNYKITLDKTGKLSPREHGRTSRPVHDGLST